jgi:hypothetical protein
MPIAWRRADQKSVLVSAAGHGIHGLVGSDLNTLQHVCNHTVFNGTFDTTPQSFANYQVRVSDESDSLEKRHSLPIDSPLSLDVFVVAARLSATPTFYA